MKVAMAAGSHKALQNRGFHLHNAKAVPATGAKSKAKRPAGGASSGFHTGTLVDDTNCILTQLLVRSW